MKMGRIMRNPRRGHCFFIKDIELLQNFGNVLDVNRDLIDMIITIVM